MASNETLALMLGTMWTPVGQPASIAYTIKGESATDQFGNAVSVVNATFAQAVAQAVQAWNNVANIRMHFVPNTTVAPSNALAQDIEDIPFVFEMAPLSGGVIGLSSTSSSGSIITETLVTMDNLFFQPSDYLPSATLLGFQVLLHEVGHSLGLAHPDDGSSFLTLTISGNGATTDGTVMNSIAGTYGTETTTGGIPVTPMIYDIAAMQYLYGANTSYNSGNNTYSFNGSQLSMTIWDGGGTDIINQAASTADVEINLREGLGFVSRIGEARVWNAFGANIENARGGSGNDTIQGNVMHNSLFGNAGNDSISGFNGNDTVRGGQGNDTVLGNAGNDRLLGDLDNDSVRGGQGVDLIRGGKGDDQLFGDEGNDTLYGDLGNDSLTGGADNDVFVFLSASGADTIFNFQLPGAGNGDVMHIASPIFTSAAQAVAACTLVGSDMVVDLGGGNSITLIGIVQIDESDFVII